MDKRDRADLLRERLERAMVETGVSQAALARATRVDPSTVSQILAPDAARLPNAQFLGEAARALRVSSDWLLGLSEQSESVADVLQGVLAVTQAERSVVDAQITRWHAEAQGYKIRHVPATLPDLLMTEAMMDWENREKLGVSPNSITRFAEARRERMRDSRSDYELAVPIHEFEAMAFAEGYYRGLDIGIRLDQIDAILATLDDMYPTLRLFLFDARRVFSAPITIFGPLQAVIYLGRYYIAFRDSDRVQLLTRHFDWLVREAEVSDRDVPDYLRALRSRISEGLQSA